MADRLALAQPTNEPPSPEVISKVLLGGDLAQLTAQQKVSYYGAVCDSIGLNPLTKPFEFLRLSGREVLYATRNATDQLRKLYDISVTITAREVMEDTYVVTARATFPSGRCDESTGAIPIAGLKGESRSNAMMKCETKAKRRVTLSLVGLSTLDESEIDSIPGAHPMPTTPPAVLGGMPPLDPPVPAARVRDRAVPPQAPAVALEGGTVAAPADSLTAPFDTMPPANMNQLVPDSWKPFIRTEAITTTITGGKRNKTTGKTTLVLEGGAEAWTTDHDLAKAAIAYKENQTPVTITLMDSGEIVTLSEATDAAF